jgi:hypothetical protein
MNVTRDSWWKALFCVIASMVLALCGWLVPAHLRAVDVAVLQRAGRGSPSISPDTSLGTQPVTPFLIHLANREKALRQLQGSDSPVVQELLRCRELTNTVLFPPSSSASGQAFDTAVSICGLLVEEGQVTPALRNSILARATAANHAGNPLDIEEVLMDVMSLGQRLDWVHLALFTAQINDPQTLTTLADSARKAGPQLPALFAAVDSSKNPTAVAQYLSTFGDKGLSDLSTSERYGAGAVNELLHRQERLYTSSVRQAVVTYVPFGAFSRATADWALRTPDFALILKWFFYLGGGFFLAMALPVRRTEGMAPEAGGGARLTRHVLFASGFLLVVLLLSEPFLAQDTQKGAVPFRLRLPSVGNVAASQIAQVKSTIMNTSTLTTSLLTLLLFFVLQALIFTACLAKLRENLRQKAPARVKLKLLENEEHLFDAGLYLGFVGTIICLILVSLGVLQFSLMAAYSSTSFGIVFVSILKIFYVRPARRNLLLEAEEENIAAEAQTRAFATAP